MTTKAHKLLTGTDLHEPKGVAAAPAGQVYVSDGAGSGVWTTISTTLSFSTGDAKLTYKTVADNGWVLLDDSTIGSVSSGAVHASNDNAALFQLLWNNIPTIYTTVIPARGGSAAADWAANKTITLPRSLGRALCIAGSGSGLTGRQLGAYTGEENHQLSLSELPTGITSANAGTIAHSATSTVSDVVRAPNGITSSNATGGIQSQLQANTATTGPITSTGTFAIGAVAVTSTNTGNAPHNTMQPSGFVNVMVKL